MLQLVHNVVLYVCMLSHQNRYLTYARLLYNVFDKKELDPIASVFILKKKTVCSVSIPRGSQTRLKSGFHINSPRYNRIESHFKYHLHIKCLFVNNLFYDDYSSFYRSHNTQMSLAHWFYSIPIVWKMKWTDQVHHELHTDDYIY